MTGPVPPVAAARHAVRTALIDLEPGDLVLVACSGGADSLALAAAACHEAARPGWKVGAVTVDHGLQSGSAERAAELVGLLRDRGLDPVEVATVTVRSGGGPEDAARRARYGALDAAAARLGAAAVLLGHTRDDQAETVLLGLARGSGARSLAGMAPRRGLYRRPFLALSRAEVRAAAEAQGWTPWDDPHNEDSTFARVRARRDALPSLEQALGPGVASALARSAELLRADADALDAWASQVSADVALGQDVLDAVRLATAPLAVRARVLRRAARAAGCPAGSVTAEHTRGLDALVAAWTGQGSLALPGGVFAGRDCGRLIFARDRVSGRGIGSPE